MPVALLLAVLWPVAELFVAIQVAHAVGVVPTIVLLIAGWPLGTWALRRQGAAAWRRLGLALGEGRTPAREVVDGALVVIGGVLLMIPGFITDAIGLLLRDQTIYGYVFETGRYDVGDKLDYLRATVETAIDREDLGPQFRAFLADLVQRKKLL